MDLQDSIVIRSRNLEVLETSLSESIPKSVIKLSGNQGKQRVIPNKQIVGLFTSNTHLEVTNLGGRFNCIGLNDE